MELTGIRTQESPLGGGRLRLVGTVAYDDRRASVEEYWFDVPERHASSLSTSGNPWLAALLPLAVTLGQPLRLSLPVDRSLYENVQELQRIWICWYPHLRPIPIEADLADPVQNRDSAKAAAFFSGGVDSWFTVLWHSAERAEPKRVPINDLLCVWGFDIPLENADGFRQMRIMLQTAAGELGKELVDVTTNLRETRWREADWTYLSHGAGLASIALALEGRYARVLLGSSGGYGDLTPWGSHVVTDHLFSTARTSIITDGSAFGRVSKTELVTKSDVALRSLRVCWKSRGHYNCCACEKCYRTMLALELFGVLDRCSTFHGNKLDLGAVARIYVTPPLRSEYGYLLACANQQRRPDVARAIERAMKKSARLEVWLSLLRALKRQRLLWRLALPLERATLGRHLT